MNVLDILLRPDIDAAMEAALAAWPQRLKKRAPMFESVKFFWPTMLDLVVCACFKATLGMPVDGKPWQSLQASQPYNPCDEIDAAIAAA